jgi:hypothetical protein
MQLQQINEVFGISLSAIEHSVHNSNIQLNSGIYQNENRCQAPFCMSGTTLHRG